MRSKRFHSGSNGACTWNTYELFAVAWPENNIHRPGQDSREFPSPPLFPSPLPRLVSFSLILSLVYRSCYLSVLQNSARRYETPCKSAAGVRNSARYEFASEILGRIAPHESTLATPFSRIKWNFVYSSHSRYGAGSDTWGTTAK